MAEGIETESQYNICKELGVNYGQGYYFAKPLMQKDLSLWLKNRQSANLRLVYMPVRQFTRHDSEWKTLQIAH